MKKPQTTFLDSVKDKYFSLTLSEKPNNTENEV